MTNTKTIEKAVLAQVSSTPALASDIVETPRDAGWRNVTRDIMAEQVLIPDVVIDVKRVPHEWPHKARLYIDMTDHDPGFSSLRPSRRRVAARNALKQLGIQSGITWSRMAGCSCGCSPGFVLDGHRGEDVFVTMRDVVRHAIDTPGWIDVEVFVHKLGDLFSTFARAA